MKISKTGLRTGVPIRKADTQQGGLLLAESSCVPLSMKDYLCHRSWPEPKVVKAEFLGWG